MATISHCNTRPVYSGIVGAYIRTNCGDQVPTCAVSANLGTEIESQEYDCNGQVYSLARITNYTVTLTVNFSLEAVSSVFGQDMIPVVSSAGINGQSVQLPTGNLPSGITLVIITRTNTGKETHIRCLDSEMSGFSISEFARGSTVTLELQFTVRNVELVEWDNPVGPDTSPLLTALRPALVWRICDCEDNDEILGPLFDETQENVPLQFGNSPEFVDKQVCCGIDLTDQSCFKADISGFASDEWGFILLGEYTQSVLLLDAGQTSIHWESSTLEMSITNPSGSLVVPFDGGPLTLAYSNDGTVIINGVSYSGMPADATASPSSFATNCNTDNGTMFSVNYFTRHINASDVR